ncbi:hypothetical protein [Thalassobius sp. MITS945101]
MKQTMRHALLAATLATGVLGGVATAPANGSGLFFPGDPGQ